MKKHIQYLSKFAIVLALAFFVWPIKSVNAQIVPVKVEWIADGATVSLEQGYKKGIPAPEKLTLSLHFDKSLLKKYTNEQLSFEFKWFYYYVTKKEFMDSYTIKFSSSQIINDNTFNVISSRGNIRHGWWEVQVISKADGEIMKFGELSRFQIYID